MYAVSCSSLGVPESKDASWRAANAWWTSKQAELDAQEAAANFPRDRLASALASLAAMHEYERTGVMPVRVGVGDVVVEFGQVAAQGEALAAPILDSLDRQEKVDPDRTVGGQAQRWYEFLRSSKRVARYSTYRRNLEFFLDEVGRSSGLESVTSFTLNDWFGTVKDRIRSGKYSPDYGRTLFGASKKFLRWLAENDLIVLPGNFHSRDFDFADVKVNRVSADDLFSNDEIASLLKLASPRMELFILLMLNCGFYQSDLSDLTEDEVDWDRGVITRARSKTRRKNVVVSYKLWPRTWRLLQEHRHLGESVLDGSGRRRVLVTDEGNPLQAYWIEGGKERRYDTFRSLWSTLAKRSGIGKAPKDLRKTSANRLGRHKEYRPYVQHFLAQAARSVANEFYLVRPPDEDFFPALEWLGLDLGVAH
jgi:integrase